jgi:hypothetical protein
MWGDPELVVDGEAAEVADDGGGVAEAEDVDLLLQLAAVGFDGDDLDGNGGASRVRGGGGGHTCGFDDASVHAAEGALAKELKELKVLLSGDCHEINKRN